jgi:hypothetical protein
VTGHLLPAAPFPSPSKNVLGDELISPIGFTILGSLPSTHGLDLEKSFLMLVHLQLV